MSVDTEARPAVPAEDPYAVRDRLQDELQEAQRDVARLNTEVGEVHDLLTAQIERLQAEVARQTQRADDAETAHQHDIEVIGRTLIDEADNRDWCDEYDRVINNLNGSLRKELPLRSKSWTVTVKVSYVTDFTVEATSREQAEDIISGAELNRTWRVTSPFLDDAISQDGTYGHDIDILITDD